MNHLTAIKLLQKLHDKCSNLICSVIVNISDEHLNWKPSEESRSISEIIRHLIRVDVWFFNQFGYEVKFKDPGKVTSQQLFVSLHESHQDIRDIISNADTNLSEKLSNHSQIKHTLAEIILHICHHYLYHYSQMVYLRRIKDRNWRANLVEWENITYSMGSDAKMLEIFIKKE